jgi:hypothetical protein
MSSSHERPAPAPAGLYDRRGFLRATSGGTAAIVLGSMLPAGCAADYPQAAADGTALEALTAKEYAVMRAAAEALLVDVPVNPAAVAAEVDRELAAVGEPIRGDMKTVLGLLEHLTFLGGHLRPFTSLGTAERLAYLRGWGTSRFGLRRGAFQAVKSFVYYYAYSQDSTRPLTHFPGPWPERLKIPPKPVDFGPIA